MKKWKVSVVVAAVALLASFEITGISAYFTSSKEEINTFTVGNIDIELKEPKWDAADEDEHKGVAPGKVIEKDPQVTNVGKNSAFVFLEVISPNLYGNNGDMMPLFSYEINDGWVDITDKIIVNNGNGNGSIGDGGTSMLSRIPVGPMLPRINRYVYAYGTDTELTELPKGETTPTLFDNITLNNIEENRMLEGDSYYVNVMAYAIQSDNIDSKDNKNPVEVYRVIMNQSISGGNGGFLQ